MSRYTGPKNRISRRFGANIFDKRRNPLAHKPNPPGQHGLRRRKKSDYGLQLQEKQKLKAVYGMLSEKQLVNYYRKAVKNKGAVAENLSRFLECRLDNVVYRLRLAPSIFAAHQLVSHGHIQVNGKKVDIRSFQVKPGMIISVKEKSRTNVTIQASIADTSREVPSYFSLNEKEFSGQLLSAPGVDEIPIPIEVDTLIVCEFLAHST
jgi:small subunit ribosomal protein S4